MTQTGEEVTQSGECKGENESVFAYNKSISVSRGMSVGDTVEQVEIRTIYTVGADTESYQMVFVFKGEVGYMNCGESKIHGLVNAYQHNLYRFNLKNTQMLMQSAMDEVICIHLSKAFLRRYLPIKHSAYELLVNSKLENKPVKLAPNNLSITPEISAIIQQLHRTSNSDIYNELLLESKVIELLALQITQYEQLKMNPVVVKQGEMEKMHQAREILIKHTGEQLSLKSLALMVGTNEYNLKRDFKAVFGSTVYGYLNQHRMEQAKTMLIENDYTIGEIAEKIGYKHATHFTNAFKKYFGYLPNKIRLGKLAWLLFVNDFFILFEQIGLAV